MNKFFISTAIGFEDELLAELMEIWPFLLNQNLRENNHPFRLVNKIKGGVEIETDLNLGYQINYFSKLAHRVLLRINDFTCTDFSKFMRKLGESEQDLKSFGSDFEFKISCSESVINNEKKVEEIVRKVFDKPTGKYFLHKVYLRIFRNQVTISLDTSGEHLHFRGNKPLSAEAPLRSTIAQFMLRQMSQHENVSSVIWADLMSGSGTLGIEIATSHKPMKREFAFQKFNNVPKMFKMDLLFNNYLQRPQRYYKIVSNEISQQTFSSLQENCKKFDIQLMNQDYFNLDIDSVDLLKSIEADSKVGRKLWIILNPPYGERLKQGVAVEQILQKAQALRAEKIGILFPDDFRKSNFSGWQIESSHPVSNGGLKTFFNVWIRTANKTQHK